jgi:hypothetical protein
MEMFEKKLAELLEQATFGGLVKRHRKGATVRER